MRNSGNRRENQRVFSILLRLTRGEPAAFLAFSSVPFSPRFCALRVRDGTAGSHSTNCYVPKYMKRLIPILALPLVLAALVPMRTAAHSYTPADILLPGEGAFEPFGLTDGGQVPGMFTPPGGFGQPAVWQDGQLTLLPLLPGTVYGWARNGNSLGHLVGACRSLSNGIYASHACVWTNGEVRALPDVLRTDQSSAWAINDTGTIAGNVYSGANGSFREAVVWNSNSVAKLQPPVAGVQTWARAINNSGQVAVTWGGQISGWSSSDEAARWTPNVPNGTTGTMTDLGGTLAIDINNAGVVCGIGGNTPYIWVGLTGYELPVNSLEYGIWGTANSINDAGMVLGDQTDDFFSPFKTFVWDAQGGIRDLNTVLAGSTPTAYPGSLQRGVDINNAGQILVQTWSSQYALLTPSALPAMPVLPTPPGSVAVTAGNGIIEVTWQGVYYDRYYNWTYNIKRSTTSGGPYTTIYSVQNLYYFHDTSVVNGTPYYYVVSTSDGINESADSVEISATPIGPLPAPALTIQRTTTNTMVVSWPSTSTGFVLQQNTNGISFMNWSNVIGTIQDDGTNKTLIVNPTDQSRFYRLTRP